MDACIQEVQRCRSPFSPPEVPAQRPELQLNLWYQCLMTKMAGKKNSRATGWAKKSVLLPRWLLVSVVMSEKVPLPPDWCWGERPIITHN